MRQHGGESSRGLAPPAGSDRQARPAGPRLCTGPRAGGRLRARRRRLRTNGTRARGAYADYRFYSDVSVDNFNAVLYGYAIYYDLAADDAQKTIIAHDVDRLMTHLLDNHCRIIDLDGEVTQYGHVGIDPDPARDDYYQTVYDRDARALQRRPSLAAFAPRQPHVTARSADCVSHYRQAALHRRIPQGRRALRRQSRAGARSRPVLARKGGARQSLQRRPGIRGAVQPDPLRERSQAASRLPALVERPVGDELDGGQLAVHLHDAGLREAGAARDGSATIWPTKPCSVIRSTASCVRS